MSGQGEASYAPGLPILTTRLVHIYHSEGHDVAALSGVDLHVAAGEYVGLLGPSGSGKSTLLSLLGGLFAPSAGTIHLGDTELSDATPQVLEGLRAGPVSLMLQGAMRNLLPYLTARENVDFAQRGARGPDRRVPTAQEVLEMVGVEDVQDRDLGELSPGQLQLVAVAVAVSGAPRLLLADEPTSQLDHLARDRVLDALTRINRTVGTTVVLVTHDPEVASSLPRTVTIRDGRVGGEGRSGREYSVVTTDGFLPLPAHARETLAPGTLVRFEQDGDRFLLETTDPKDEA